MELIDDKYEILSKIGSGGTSIVYKARRLADDRIVAVKVIRDGLEDIKEHERHFRLEAEALSKMSHRNIRRILGVGQWNDSLYMVTEYIDGKTLKDTIVEEGPLSAQRAVDYALQIAAGIEHAHRKNIIHRDIKPQNVIVSNDGTVKIVDFGIARMLSQTTRTMGGKDVVGSVHYISPEQARGAQVDSRTDIYSFGIVLYEMFTGKVPFEGEEAVSIAMKHINQIPEAPQSVNPNITKGINDIIVKCIQKDPDMRYQTASELREDLLLYCANPEGFAVIAANKLKGREDTSEYTDSEGDSYDERPVRRVRPAKEIRERAERREDAVDENDGVKRRVSYINSEEREKAKKSKLKKTIIIVLAIAVSAAVVISAVFWAVSAMLGDSKYPEKVIPEVAGLSKNAAVAVLRAESFSKFEFVKENAVDVPQDMIIRTDPAEGTAVKVNTEIKIYISSGAEAVMAENTVGKTIDEATDILEAQGFKVHCEYVSDETKENGTVTEQSNSTQAVAVGSTITIKVVRNIQAKKLVVPDLRECKTINDAKNKIIESGFKVGNYQEEKTDDANRIGVGTQSPSAGTEYVYIEGENPPEVEIDFTVYVSSGFRCVYEYDIPDGQMIETELIIYNSADEQIKYEKFGESNRVSYTYTSEREETVTFELYSGSLLIDKRTMNTTLKGQE